MVSTPAGLGRVIDAGRGNGYALGTLLSTSKLPLYRDVPLSV